MKLDVTKLPLGGVLVGFVLAAVVVTFALAFVFAPDSGIGESEPPPGPQMVMDGDSFDVGAITIGETVERTIEFRNEGQEPLTVSILKIRPAPGAD